MKKSRQMARAAMRAYWKTPSRYEYSRYNALNKWHRQAIQKGMKKWK